MEIKSIPLSAYGNIEMPEKKIANVSQQEQVQYAAANMVVNEKGNVTAAGDASNGQASEQNDKSNQLKNAIDMATYKLKFTRTKCEFKYYEDINRVAIKVLDRDTEEVIREIPPEETIELVQKLWELAGIIVDEKR